MARVALRRLLTAEPPMCNYQELPSLDAYVLVDQQRVAVTLYRPLPR